MPLKVLLADDSVPAQNMGKKILTDAGYEVMTVSNGLEALRKIADVIPDIAILDIFMPGYTGLEICERLRASAATALLPVILTVGKLEPYRPEDGEHVRSNAVIVKPFAAAELTSAVRSLIGTQRAEVQRAPETEERPPAPVADPPQQDLAPAAYEPPPSPPVAESPATPWQFADVSPAEVPDEPLFSGVEFGTASNAETLPPQFAGASAQGVEPLRSDEDPLGAESLVFNPQAAHTPFSASAVEAPPADSHLPAEAGPSGFTEFDLEPEASPYSAGPSPVESELETWNPAPEVVEQGVAEPNDAAADGELAGSNPLAIAAEPAMATSLEATSVEATESGEAVGAATAAAELESSPLEVPAIERLAEAEAAASRGVAESSAAADEVPEEYIPEGADSNGEVALPATAAQNENASRLAFEDLYNSEVPIPVEGGSVPFPGPAMVTSPSLTEPWKHELRELEPDPEIVMVAPWTAVDVPAPDAERMEAFQPVRAIEPIFDGEQPLEDKTPAVWFSPRSVEQPAEAPASADNSTLLPNVTGDSMPQFYAEAPAEAPESPRAVAAVESEPLPPVASPERSQLVAEVAKVEALLVQMQAVGQVDQAETELAHPEIEFQPSDAASYFLQPDASTVEPESAAVPAHEPVQQETQEEAVTETAQIETELPPSEDVPVQCEPEAEPEQVGLPPEMAPAELAHPGTEAWVDETSSQTSPALAQRLDDAERIHRAVEKVFDRFRPLLVAAIVREMARLD